MTGCRQSANCGPGRVPLSHDDVGECREQVATVVKRAPVSGNMLSRGSVRGVSMTSHCMSPRFLSTYAIMPHVRCSSAGRLFGIPLDATARIFSQLIEDGALRLTPDGRYRRATSAA